MYFYAALLLFPTALPAQISKTVTGVVTHNEGYKTVTYTLPAGTIKVVVTDDQGNYTSGSLTGNILLEAAGKSKPDKNLKELMEHSLVFDGHPITIQSAEQAFSYPAHASGKNCTVQLNHKDGSSNPLEWRVASARPLLGDLIPKKLGCPQRLVFKDAYLPLFSNTDALQFMPTDRFFISDTRSPMREIKPHGCSPRTAIFRLPQDVYPGPVNISMYRDDKLQGQETFYYYDLQFTSPNTNLRSGQTSTVTAKIETAAEKGSIQYPMQLPFTLDVKNLSGDVIGMQGGNFQHFEFPNAGDISNPSAWSVTRVITGVVPGSFNITATLYPDNSVTEDPFVPEMYEMQTPEEFNNWLKALRADLSSYVNAPRTPVTKWILENTMECASPDKLEECRAYTGMLLRNALIPKGAAVLWSSSLEAAKTACNHIKAGMPVNFNLIRNGLSCCEHLCAKLKKPDPSIFLARTALQEAMLQHTAGNLENCRAKSLQVFSHYSMVEKLPSLYNERDMIGATYSLLPPRTPGGVHPFNDLIGYVNASKKMFYIDPAMRTQVLSAVNAVAISNNWYSIRSKAGETEKYDTVRIGDVSPQDYYINHPEDDGLGGDPPPASVPKRMDTVMRVPGIDYHIYKNAQCHISQFKKTTPCDQDLDFKNWVQRTEYEKTECTPGDSICVEVTVTKIKLEIFSNKKCDPKDPKKQTKYYYTTGCAQN